MDRWNENDARKAFATLPGMGARSLGAIETLFGRFALAADLPPLEVASALDAVVPAGGRALRRVPDLRAHLEATLARAERVGARILCPGDPEWPARLASLRVHEASARPPRVLWVRGRLDPIEQRYTLGIVGARRADGLARAQAHDLARALAEAGVSVISGGAAGVDGQAHRGALDGGGHTVVVLGTGVDVAYPARHRGLFEEVLERGGALVSELPPGTKGSKGTFPRRNRILSGLSDLLLVVAAARGSGSLITARLAEAQGRGVCAIPGDPRRRLSEGPNGLLVDGALAALDARHLLTHLLDWGPEVAEAGRIAELLDAAERRAGVGAEAGGPQLPISNVAERVLAALDTEGRSPDEIARALGLSAAEVAGALTELELGGLAQRVSGAYVLRSSTHQAI